MARMRMVKPEFWASEQIVECSTTARLLFIGLWNFCDDNGVHPASLKRLKMEVFPADSFTQDDMVGWMGELTAETGEEGKPPLVGVYEANERQFWWVTGFKTHQRIDRPTYRYPPPPTDRYSTSPRRALDEPSRRTVRYGNGTDGTVRERKGPVKEPERNGRERNGREGNEPSSVSAKKFFSSVSEAQLRDDAELMALFMGAVRLKIIPNSEKARLDFWGAACHALRKGDNPAALFVSVVQDGNWDYITCEDEDQARGRLKGLGL